MATAPTPPAAASAPSTSPSHVVAAWPRSAQLATAFLLGLSTALLIVHVCSSLRWGTRPAEVDRAPIFAYRIDLNQADRAQLLQVPGVGPSLAENIEAYRRENGQFRRVEDLTKVRGIGPAALERMRSWVCVHAEDQEEETPTPVEKRSRSGGKGKQTNSGKVAAKKAGNPVEPVNINQATVEELQRVPGIGPVTAQRIVEERQKAPFKSVDDLRRVSGIGPTKLERLRPYVTVNRNPSQVVAAEES